MAAKPGEVWLADLGLAAKTRSVVILSRDDPQAPRALVVYVPLTTQNRGSHYENRTRESEVLERNVCCECSRYWLDPGDSFAEKTWLTLDRDFRQDQASDPFHARPVTGLAVTFTFSQLRK